MAVTKRVRKVSGIKKIFFHAEVYVRGIRVASRTFDTLAAAHTWHDAEKQKIETGQIAGAPELKDTTFGDCIERYVNEALPRLRKSSQQSFEARLPYFREASIKNVKMRDFGPHTVDEWLGWLYRQPTRLNPGRKSFLHELKHLTVVLGWYRNYCDAMFVVPIVKRHRERAVFKEMPQRRPDYFMRPEDVMTWVAWLKENRTNPVYHQLAHFMTLTGTRVGEACGLCWDAVDLDRRMARVIRTVTWDHWTRVPSLVETTKSTESVRLLPLAEDVVSMLRKMKEEATGKLVFHDGQGKPIRYNRIQSAFNAGFRGCDLPWRSTHICRHTFGTIALMATKDLSAVQASLGHRNRSVTERYAKAVAMLSSATADKTAMLLKGLT